MPAAVLDVELTGSIPNVGGLERYTSAFVGLRLGGIPVGQCWVPVKCCRLDSEQLRKCAEAAVPAFSHRWVERQLGRDMVPGRDLPSATIAICTRDRPNDLARALDAVAAAAQKRPVLVVD